MNFKVNSDLAEGEITVGYIKKESHHIGEMILAMFFKDKSCSVHCHIEIKNELHKKLWTTLHWKLLLTQTIMQFFQLCNSIKLDNVSKKNKTQSPMFENLGASNNNML